MFNTGGEILTGLFFKEVGKIGLRDGEFGSYRTQPEVAIVISILQVIDNPTDQIRVMTFFPIINFGTDNSETFRVNRQCITQRAVGFIVAPDNTTVLVFELGQGTSDFIEQPSCLFFSQGAVFNILAEESSF